MRITDAELFELALRAANCLPKTNRSIGTENETTLHSALKYCFQPDPKFHELRISGYICDAFSGTTVYEIQTSQLYKLRRKLSVLLPEYRLTVIYPVITEKRVVLSDADGNVVREYKSPKKGSIMALAAELYGIREFLTHPRFSVAAVYLTVAEMRKLTAGKRKKSTVTDKIPEKFSHVEFFREAEAYRSLLPESLADSFTAADFFRAAKVPEKTGRPALNVLTVTGAVMKTGKSGRCILYSKTSQHSETV